MQNGTDLAQSGTEKKLPRTHQDYWRSRLVKRSYAWEGKTIEIPEWQIRIAYLGRREWFNLDTPNQSAAAMKARDIYLSLLAHGWVPTLQKFKPEMEVKADGCTVGEFLEAVKGLGVIDLRTFEIYAKKFRSLVAGVFGIESGKAKFYHKGETYKAWLNRVHAIRLDRLTPAKVNEWQSKQISDAKNPLQQKHAKSTVKSVLLNSKSLFGKKVLPKLKEKGFQLPAVLPFDGVELPKVKVARYRSSINPALLFQQAKRELQTGDPELFKIFILALGAGLRRDEIDTLEYRQINWQAGQINVETTEHTETKSDGSEAPVNVDPALLQLLRECMPKPGKGGQFVITSAVESRPQATTYHHYRCNRLFKRFVEWLRAKGVQSRNPIHTLRKEFGNQLCQQAGIYAASEQLRHSNIRITRDYYTGGTKAVFKLTELGAA